MRYFIALIAVLAIAVFGLPYLIQDQTIRWLKSQGVVDPRFEDIEFEWWTGAVILKGLYAQAEHKPLLHVEQLTIELNYAALFDKRILIDQIKLSGVHIGLQQTATAFYVGPIDINQFKAQQPAVDQADTAASDWQFGIKQVLISDLLFSVDIKPFKQQLQITQASIEDVYQWQPTTPTNFDLKGLLNHSALKISASGTPFAAHKKSQLRLNIKDLAIESVTSGVLPQLSGVLNIELALGLDIDNTSISVSHNGRVELASLAWQEAPQNIKLENLLWQGTGDLHLAKGQLASASLSGKLGLKQLEIVQKKQKILQLATLKWQGPLQVTFASGELHQLSVSENLSLTGLLFNRAASKVSVKQLLAKTGSEPLSISLDKGIAQRISASTALSIKGLSYAQKGVKLSAQNLTVNGRFDVSDLHKTPSLTAKPRLKVTALRLHLAKSMLIKSGSLQLTTQLNKINLAKPMASNINLNLTSFSVDNVANGLSLVSLNKLILKKANYTANEFNFSQLDISKLKVAALKKATPVFSANVLQINKMQLIGQQQLTIKKISVSGTNSHLQIAESGRLVLLEKLQAALSGPQKTKKATPVKKVFSYAIGEIAASGSNKIQIEDKSVNPWFKSQLDISQLRVTALNSRSANTVPLRLKAKINDSAILDFSASITPFAATKDGRWSLHLRSLSMPVISPYAGKFSGYFLESGKISLQSNGTISANIIKGENKVEIQQLSVRSAGSAATSKTNSSLNMPLDVAISVLEDSEGNIKLSIPVTGSMDDPNFGYSSIVEIIAKKGLKQAAFGILSKALQPYGALITIAKTAIEAKQNGAFINLAPIIFSPGKAVVSRKMRGYLSKIAAMMKARKKLKLKICATGVLQDKLVLSPEILLANEALENPASQKVIEKSINNVIQQLATSRNKIVETELKRLQVSSDRLFVCFAKTNFKNTKLKSEVKLGL